MTKVKTSGMLETGMLETSLVASGDGDLDWPEGVTVGAKPP